VRQGVDVVVAVALERPAAAMKLTSIEFDDDALSAKQDVDLATTHERVELEGR
jgi:hypothetical protein